MLNSPSSQHELQESLKLIARNNLVDYGIMMDHTWIPAWYHEMMAEAFMKVENGQIKRLMITLPPRHGKSRLASELFPSWFIGKNPHKEIITASYSFDLAGDFGRKVRNLVDEPNYKAIFGTQLAEDSSAKGRWHTREGGGYVAAGVGGSITGRGAHLLNLDDLFKDRKEAESELRRKNVMDWYTSTALTRLSPDGAVVICNTRWHDADLCGELLKSEPEKWTHINLPAIATEDDAHRKTGEALWQARYSLPILEEIKASIGSYDWSALYQQNPIDEESAQFKRSMFRYHDQSSLPDRDNMWIVSGVDPAISKAQTADYSAVVTLGITRSLTENNYIGRAYVLDYVNKRMNPSELIDAIFDQKKKWNVDVFAIETVAYQAALVHFLKDAMKRRNLFLRVEEVKSTVAKEKRINGLIPYYQNNIVEHASWMQDLEEQLLRFPVGAHDDMIDSMAMTVPFWVPPAVIKQFKQQGKSVKQIEKDEKKIQYQTLDRLSLP